MFSLYQTIHEIPEDIKNEARNVYLEDRRKSVSECTFALIKYLRTKIGIRFAFDWEDWDKFTASKEPGLKRLYLVLATFYQFGFSLQIDFCCKFLDGVDKITIIDTLGESYNLPIYRKGNHLFLRHETIATWYLDETDEETRKNRLCSKEIFKGFLNNIEDDFSKDMFIWLYKSRDFRESYLGQLISVNGG